MIKIYTFQFNDPDFLEYQYIGFKRFLKEEHQLICINNCYDKPAEKEAIRLRAEELGIPHYFPENTHHKQGGHSHQAALNWTWKTFIAGSEDINIIVDHDMFPIREIKYDLNYDIIGVAQGRGEHIRYFHPGFMIVNNTLRDRETVDFTGQMIDGHHCDSGGNWHHYLLAHPDLKIKGLILANISQEQGNLETIPLQFLSGYNESDPMQLLEDYIIHFRNGSNWAWTEKNKYNHKKEQLKSTLNHYISL